MRVRVFGKAFSHLNRICSEKEKKKKMHLISREKHQNQKQHQEAYA